MSAPTTSSSCTNCTRGSKPRISGTTGSSQRVRERRDDVVAEHVGEAQQRDVDVRVVVGEVAEERLDLEQRALDVGARRARARHLLAEPVRVLGVAP